MKESKWRRRARGSAQGPLPGGAGRDNAKKALSDDPSEYRQIWGEAPKRILGVSIVCGGCGKPTGVMLCRDNDEVIIESNNQIEPGLGTRVYARTADDYPPAEKLDELGEPTAWAIYCSQGCRGRRGGLRELLISEGRAQRLVDALAESTPPNSRHIVRMTLL